MTTTVLAFGQQFRVLLAFIVLFWRPSVSLILRSLVSLDGSGYFE
jgi:hypothetical protein